MGAQEIRTYPLKSTNGFLVQCAVFSFFFGGGVLKNWRIHNSKHPCISPTSPVLALMCCSSVCCHQLPTNVCRNKLALTLLVYRFTKWLWYFVQATCLPRTDLSIFSLQITFIHPGQLHTRIKLVDYVDLQTKPGWGTYCFSDIKGWTSPQILPVKPKNCKEPLSTRNL